MIIAHSCTQCGCADFHRDDRRGGRTAYCPEPCKCQNCTPGEATLRPTYDRAGDVIERIIPPGGKSEGSYIVACSCTECHGLYELLTATVTAEAS
ncbi:hypothetical protein ACBJ59_36260 [Nonomuraea sp. MTCD27]|uniref:hypothetical protein n=1 Tax=Nonomuraea sp. MTCD27 TaxID=1676747 RepID=UPI0035C0B5A4